MREIFFNVVIGFAICVLLAAVYKLVFGNRAGRTKLARFASRVGATIRKLLRRLPHPIAVMEAWALKTSAHFRPHQRQAGAFTVELSLDPDYVSWDLWACVRELLQNAKDADDLGYKMRVSQDGGTLRVSNQGAKLTRKSLILGGTTKRGTEARGQFGEGYKLAFASLLSKGHRVVVYNRDEVWVPTIKHSAAYDATVVVVEISQAEVATDDLTFEVSNVGAYQLEAFKKRLLFDRPDVEAGRTPDGILLTANEFVGKLFVKGIFISDLPGNYRFGYDLFRLKINRDRNLADPWSLKREIHFVLEEAVKAKIVSVPILYSSVASGFDECTAIADEPLALGVLPKMLVAEFEKRHGDNAIPVCSDRERSIAELLGREPITVDSKFGTILNRGGLSIERLKCSEQTEIAKVWGPEELTAKERFNLDLAVKLARRHESFSDPVVATYFGDSILGLYAAGGHISLAKEVLTNRVKTIATLVHEVAHKHGGDGTVAHRHACEQLFSKIIDDQLKRLEDSNGK